MVSFAAENCLIHWSQRGLLLDKEEVAVVFVSLRALRQPKLQSVFVPENENKLFAALQFAYSLSPADDPSVGLNSKLDTMQRHSRNTAGS